MNTIFLSVACVLSQIQPSQFDPGQGVSPVRPAPIAAESNFDQGGGSFRLTDQELDLPAPPAYQEPESPSQLRPAQSWSTPREPQSVATPASDVGHAQAQSPIIPVHSSDLEALAGMILDGAIEMRTENGTDIALVDLLRRIGDNSSRQRAVQSYWRLCLAMAEQNFARHESRYLSELAKPQTQLDETLLVSEITQARARQATAALRVVELQEQLVEVGRLEMEGLPRPVDRPFVGPYATHFEKLFASRPAPTNLKRIDRRLPHELEVIERRAEAVAAGERAATQLAEAYDGGGVSMSHVLDSLAQLSRTRRELLAAVLSYNEQIAEYSFSVVRPGVPTESLLGTLIRQEAAAQPTLLADANVRRASAEAPVREAGEVDGSLPLRPTADPQGSRRDKPSGIAPGSESILKRVTIDHP
ncbi:MAG: hypothetical protein H6821_08405 [Planctomycetaceae bacterium]|nr:hypothetical protein [Planctomycetales bacterium]MCB9874189.1 hypothetical protein [Planctomycetaceae bacterium]MCB9940830.1 hypothetical protein [Planctomycetaceae bacterium]HRX77700.1 hypothetical protein [Pirellulaceae bacterium]